jgi:hypothetical protein
MEEKRKSLKNNDRKNFGGSRMGSNPASVASLFLMREQFAPLRWSPRSFFATIVRTMHSAGNKRVSSGITAALAGCLLMVCAPVAGAQEPQPGGAFTFKRIGVPGQGSKRITVQIDPNQEIYRITPGSQPRRPGDPRPDEATQ